MAWRHRTALLLALVVLALTAAGQTLDPDTLVVPESPNMSRTPVHSQRTTGRFTRVVTVEGDTIALPTDSVSRLDGVEVLGVVDADSIARLQLGKERQVNVDPKRALWLSALCPGLGQIYNRRYWKLPIVAGAFLGMSYGTLWNNRMLQDYTRAYRDAMDNDPNTRSYMDFYPPTTQESSLDMEWLKRSLKNKKNYYRRYRDLCIIGMVALYGISIIDAYVDASMANFDISPDLTMKVTPAVMPLPYDPVKPSLGMRCALSF